jgi:hypothetical protein
MKKSVLFIILLVAIFLFPFITAQTNATQINSGFTCLNNKIGDCSALSLSEQIFSSLADGKCTSLISGGSSNGCWPTGSCDIKTTAQAILALQNSGVSTSNSLAWLTSQEITSPDVSWFMQINTNSNSSSSCTVSYAGSSYPITINSNKAIANGAGSCLSVSPNGYWFSISPNCYGNQFTISCNQSFATTNLYQRQNYPTIYVSSSSNSASSGGQVVDNITSKCFGSGGTCNLEATLWASLALTSAGQSVSSFMPYLTVMSNDPSNQQFLPYAFLYALTSSSDYMSALLSEQKTVNGQTYWDQGSAYGPYYDTALALLPLQSQSQTSQGQTNAIDWLVNTQGSDGCWNSDNILDTAFILYAISGSRAQNISTSCTTSGYYCSSGLSCTQNGGNVLSNYNCPGTNICCSKQPPVPNCASQGGQVCNLNQSCSGNPTSASDVNGTSGTCCIGSCGPSAVLTPSNCDISGGVCRSACLSGEQPSSQTCALSTEVCCVQPPSSGTVWIWILAVLIILLLLGIIFRKKLRVLWFRIKSKFKKGGGGKPQSGMPPRPSFFPGPPMNFQRRPIPPQPQRPIQRPRQRPSEVNDVLKKLKEISK